MPPPLWRREEGGFPQAGPKTRRILTRKDGEFSASHMPKPLLSICLHAFSISMTRVAETDMLGQEGLSGIVSLPPPGRRACQL